MSTTIVTELIYGANKLKTAAHRWLAKSEDGDACKTVLTQKKKPLNFRITSANS